MLATRWWNKVSGPVSGPEAALAEHGRWLRAVATARLRSSEGVEDVLQEVAIGAMRNWKTLSDPANAKAWLYRLTVRAALMHRRTLGRARRRIQEAAHGAQEKAAGKNSPLDFLLDTERQLRVRRAMGRLASKDAEMLMLKHVEECSYQEIATRLGTTPSVVQMRLFRARQRLRELLTPTDAPGEEGKS